MSVQILHGDCRKVLATLPEASVHCCVTSPPYWGLRDYGVDGQIGLEQSIDDWVDEMVAVFRDVRRVLRDDGTLWLNLGDSYATRPYGDGHTFDPKYGGRNRAAGRPNRNPPSWLKHKDLIGQPWMAAFALRADGWYLRQEIIWHKPNPMPESVRDRCTKAHEQVFLLSKSPKYFYDFEAMQEPVSGTAHARRSKTGVGFGHGYDANPKPRAVGRREGPPGNPSEMKAVAGKLAEPGSGVKSNASMEAAIADLVDTRNRRSVWSIPSEPFSGAHFATFPPALAEPCIKAGCPQGGMVLDPFFGAGTTGLVADRLHRNCLGIELNPEYAEIARRRIHGDAPLFAEVA